MANPTTARQLLFAALVFAGLIAGCFTIISVFVPTDAGSMTEYNASLLKFEEMNANLEGISDSTRDATPEEGSEGILTGLYASSFGAIRQGWTSVTVMKEIIEDFSEGAFGIRIPAWFTGMLATIILVTFAFALISSWRKWYT